MEKRNLYIVVAIVLIAGLVLSFTDLTGSITSLGKCTETDNGDNPGVPGITKYALGKQEYKDTCYAKSGTIEKRLMEHYCLDKITTRRYYCNQGCVTNEAGIGYCKNSDVDLLSDE